MARADVLVPTDQRDLPSAGTVPLLLTGRSAAVTRLRAGMAAAAAAGHVLIVAEPGLDAPDIAADLHDRGRADGPFVRIDCAAAEPPIIERDLFGAASSGAPNELETIHAASALARAHGGSLFLSDVAELSAGAQARLARVARDGEVLLDGVPQRLDVRLIASVSSDVEGDVADGRLRRDMIRQLSRARLDVPPLRHRPDDIPTLVEHLVVFACAGAGVAVKDVTQPAMTLLAAMPWRGNLGELRGAIDRFVAAVDGPLIQLEDVLTHVRFDGSLSPSAPAGPLRGAREQFEREYVTLVLRHHQWRISEAARTLGIQRTNLYRKARQLGIVLTRPGVRG
jgi:two-component system, NtrC family, nitrogen regulation response regulator NtrX